VEMERDLCVVVVIDIVVVDRGPCVVLDQWVRRSGSRSVRGT
jgi:hypothetical protein